MMQSLRSMLPGVCSLILLFCFCATESKTTEDAMPTEPTKLAVVWTSGDRDVALKMVYMYAYNAKLQGWWDEVQFIVWGPSSKLLSVDKELQEYIQKMQAEEIDVVACQSCADSYGVSDDLRALGIDVKYMGMPLTELLKDSEWKVITF